MRSLRENPFHKKARRSGLFFLFHRATFQGSVIRRDGGPAEKQHTQDRFRKVEGVERRLVIRPVDLYLVMQLSDSFVFHVGWFK
jgi:hypothetical protein